MRGQKNRGGYPLSLSGAERLHREAESECGAPGHCGLRVRLDQQKSPTRQPRLNDPAIQRFDTYLFRFRFSAVP